LIKVVVKVTLITALNINKASLVVISRPTTLLFYIFLRIAVLLLVDIALGLWSAISSIRAIAVIAISVLVLTLVVLMVALICKKRLGKTVLLRPIRGILFST